MMAAHLMESLNLSRHFNKFKLQQIPREENEYADALLELASIKDVELFKIVQTKLLSNINQLKEGKEGVDTRGNFVNAQDNVLLKGWSTP